ncbi:MAG: hypothetical protein ACXVAY_21985 [Mucilaginibacter sp.]
MSLQFISDSSGETTGVFIPIKEWNEMKSKFHGIEEAELEVPDWQVSLVRKRRNDQKNSTDQAIDFDIAMDDIEKEL